jgi:hypothetical protein
LYDSSILFFERFRFSLLLVPGAENKFLFGRELYGPFQIPLFYSTSQQLIAVEYFPFYSPDQIYGLIIFAIHFAHRTHRTGIRLTGWEYVHGPDMKYEVFHALYDADYLMKKYNLTLFESHYWKGVEHYSPSFSPVKQEIEISFSLKDSTLSDRITDLEDKYAKEIADKSVNELTIVIENAAFLAEVEEETHGGSEGSYQTLLCREYTSRKPKCSGTCQG